MRRGKRTQDLALAAGAVVAGVAGCDKDGGHTICDPAPPPLCDRLDRESGLAMTADRDTIPAGESAIFTGTVTDTSVSAIDNVAVNALDGWIEDVRLTPPRTFTFRWNNIGNREGQTWIDLDLQVDGILNGKRDTCWLRDEITLSVNGQGVAVIDSLPGSNRPLPVHFDVAVTAAAKDGAQDLTATTTLTADEARRVTWRWRADAGTLEPDGAHARFTPPAEGDAAVIQVEAVLDGASMAIGVWEWRRR